MPNETAPNVGLGRLYPTCLSPCQREVKPLEKPGKSYFEALIDTMTSERIKVRIPIFS
jgi:hypothetical protein